ncbi:hypothetical protein [Natrinema gelatinilyticum]|uniref:hypothetical protein n=1 Tax=Natrinema gelatinilyticum TaxID=2961571 RepID=UPI0020C2AC5A|nr:hypothetical protein [Natrinema gelatinilyticum]
MAVTLPEAMLEQYERFSLYNSPYPAHDGGCAVDLYPGTLVDGRTTAAPSPVAGTVTEIRSVRAPPKPYAPEHDHLILIDCEGPAPLDGMTVRILHVEPTVEVGDGIDCGDSLGRLVRAGFFAPWVDNHLHVGFRAPEQNPYRASGSLPIELEVSPRPLAWDGSGRVVSSGDTYVVLDAPAHPDPGTGFVGVRADGGGVLDGGMPHYEGGGVFRRGRSLEDGSESVSLNGDRLGVADGRTVAWDGVTVTANDDPITGLSLFCARDGDFGAKLICPDRAFDVGERVQVRVRSDES